MPIAKVVFIDNAGNYWHSWGVHNKDIFYFYLFYFVVTVGESVNEPAKILHAWAIKSIKLYSKWPISRCFLNLYHLRIKNIRSYIFYVSHADSAYWPNKHIENV